jgi:hypothetical protein
MWAVPSQETVKKVNASKHITKMVNVTKMINVGDDKTTHVN